MLEDCEETPVQLKRIVIKNLKLKKLQADLGVSIRNSKEN